MHYSTAYDMALLGAEAVKNPDFSEICGSKKFTAQVSETSRTYYNHNRLLSEIDGCIGVKTGFTKKSGRCLVSAVRRGGRTLVCVTLNAGSDWSDHKKLYNKAFDGFSEIDLKGLMTEQSIGLVNSQKSEVLLEGVNIPKILVRDGEKITLKVLKRPFEYASVLKGEKGGVCKIIVNGAELDEFDLVYKSSAVHIGQTKEKQNQGIFEKLRNWLYSLFK